MLVSVIMNCLNCEKYLKEAIDSVYNQTYSDWEIIFWDNASTDKSGEIARGYDHRVYYYRGEDTVPLGEARNKAIEKANGELIAFLDCDDVWMPDKLEKQVRLFDDPEVGLAFSDAYFFNEKGIIKQIYKTRPYKTGFCFGPLLEDYFIVMVTSVLRKKALDGLDHWFDSRFNMIEEYDLFLRVAQNWKLAMVDEPLAKWRVHENSWTFRKMDMFAEETLQMLDSFREINPDFESLYAKEIETVLRNSDVTRAMHLIRSGRSKEARSYLHRHKFFGIKHFALYCLSYTPWIFSKIFKFKFKLD